MNLCHGGMDGMHLGRDKTYQKVLFFEGYICTMSCIIIIVVSYKHKLKCLYNKHNNLGETKELTLYCVLYNTHYYYRLQMSSIGKECM